jgi:hypothetical protein
MQNGTRNNSPVVGVLKLSVRVRVRVRALTCVGVIVDTLGMSNLAAFLAEKTVCRCDCHRC